MEKIILLSNNENVKCLYNWLVSKGYNVLLCHDPITISIVDEYNPDLVISYNYIHIVKEDVINKLENRIINMHISYLPWNKGASPNIWSFIEDTPKGVTIHRLEKGLDTGKIIIQKECSFDEDVETLSSTYEALNNEIVQLLEENWEIFEKGVFDLKDQCGEGSYHRVADLDRLLAGKTIDYNMTITDFKKFINGILV